MGGGVAFVRIFVLLGFAPTVFKSGHNLKLGLSKGTVLLFR